MEAVIDPQAEFALLEKDAPDLFKHTQTYLQVFKRARDSRAKQQATPLASDHADQEPVAKNVNATLRKSTRGSHPVKLTNIDGTHLRSRSRSRRRSRSGKAPRLPSSAAVFRRHDKIQ